MGGMGYGWGSGKSGIWIKSFLCLCCLYGVGGVASVSVHVYMCVCVGRSYGRPSLSVLSVWGCWWWLCAWECVSEAMPVGSVCLVLVVLPVYLYMYICVSA